VVEVTDVAVGEVLVVGVDLEQPTSNMPLNTTTAKTTNKIFFIDPLSFYSLIV
jgi:hypothetical protein